MCFSLKAGIWVLCVDGKRYTANLRCAQINFFNYAIHCVAKFNSDKAYKGNEGINETIR